MIFKRLISLIDGTLIGTTTPGQSDNGCEGILHAPKISRTTTPCQSESGSNGSEEVLLTLQIWSLTIKCSLVSYPGHSLL